MGLKDVLQSHKVPLPADFDERLDIVIAGLKKSPDFEKKLSSFKKQRGGEDIPIPVKADPEDYLGPRVKWFVEVMGSPYAQTVVRTLFMVIFFVSYLESIPMFGSILGAGLDIMVAGGKALTKTIQSSLPAIFGLLPIPYAALAGVGAAAVYGMIVWPMLAMVSFSRQDFANAIESSIRVIPPPVGNILADMFTEANRMVARIDVKRQKVAKDISDGIKFITETFSSASSQFKTNASDLATKTVSAAASTAAAASAKPTGGKRFSRHGGRNTKWRTRRNELRKYYANG